MEFMVQQVSKGLPEIQGHDLLPSFLWLVWVRTKCHLCGGCEVPNPRGLLSRNRLIGMCCWMGSHFHDSIDFNGVTISTESLEWGRKLSRFWIMQCNFFLFFFIFVFDSHSLRENDCWLCKYYNKWRKWKAGAKWREWKKGSRQHAQGTLFSN